jgi:hypothetical protein
MGIALGELTDGTRSVGMVLSSSLDALAELGNLNGSVFIEREPF